MLLPMAEFVYNNSKNASIGHMSFELNYGYYLCVSFEENTDLCSWLKLLDELLAELPDLMAVCQKNVYYT